MAFVTLDANGNITGMFGIAQNPPTPPGYAVIADSDPRIATFQAALTPTPSITFLQFIALFTPSEQLALANSADAQTRLFVITASGAGAIQLNNAEVVQGVNYVASIGLITSARAAQILAGQSPS